MTDQRRELTKMDIARMKIAIKTVLSRDMDNVKSGLKIALHDIEKMENELLQKTQQLAAMTDEIARLREAQRWIPVTERVPEMDKQYLCRYIFNGHNDRPFYQTLDYYAADETPHFQHTMGIDGMKVTHWMPLPEAPCGKDGEGE